MDFLIRTHPTQDDMELYAMHKAAEPIVEGIEEHLLLCEKCRSALDSVEQQIRMMRIVLRDCELTTRIQ